MLGHHSTTRTSSQILARIAELRPVLPRPSPDGFNQGGPVHLPSTGISHGHASRLPEHVFKPYERNYSMTHHHPAHFQSYQIPGPSNPTFGFNDQSFTGQMMGVAADNPWSPRQGNGPDNSGFPFPSLCGCGDDCSCPGCLHHNRSTAIPSSSAYSSCSNPGACGACLDCTILSLPPSAIPPPDTALSIYDSQPDAIDDWLRQMLSSTSSESFQNFPPNGAQFQQPPPQSWGSRSFPYSDQQSNNLDRNPRIQSPFAYGRSPPPSMGFVTSGEGSSDYPQRAHRPQSPQSNMDGRPVIDPRLLPPNGMASYFSQLRSRSPSSSSQSSHQSSQDNQGSGSVPIYRPSERVQGIFPNVHGVRTSPPQMNIRHLINRGPSSASTSTSPSSGSSSSTRPPYAGNSGDGSRSSNPSLAGLHIY